MREGVLLDDIETLAPLSAEDRRELALLALVARVRAFRAAQADEDGIEDRAPALADLFEAADRILVQLGWADEPPWFADR